MKPSESDIESPRSIISMSDEPYKLSHRFQNLQNPLKFIESENENIIKLKDNYEHTKTTMKKQQDYISQFSKSIYKKVISRDNDYTFTEHDHPNYDIMTQFNNKYSIAGKIEEHKKTRQYKQNLKKSSFKHEEIISIEEKRQRQRQQKQIPINFQHIKIIETSDFDEQYRNVEFYNIIKNQREEQSFQAIANSSNQISDSLEIYQIIEKFKPKLIEDSQYFTKNSFNLLFNSERELKFWKVVNIFSNDAKSQEDILSTCAFLDAQDISMTEMFDFSTRNIEIDDIAKFYKLKKNLDAKMTRDKNNESLEEKYNQDKKRFEEMKQNKLKSKNQRIPVKYRNTLAQTSQEMKQKQFDDYFEQQAKNIFERLKKLNDVRDRIVSEQQGQTFKTMATNISIQISKELFKLLLLMLKGQSCTNYSQFINRQNSEQVEKKILHIIYTQFKNFEEFQVNGVSKIDIIKTYLQQREKNQRFYQTYIFSQK